MIVCARCNAEKPQNQRRDQAHHYLRRKINAPWAWPGLCVRANRQPTIITATATALGLRLNSTQWTDGSWVLALGPSRTVNHTKPHRDEGTSETVIFMTCICKKKREERCALDTSLAGVPACSTATIKDKKGYVAVNTNHRS